MRFYHTIKFLADGLNATYASKESLICSNNKIKTISDDVGNLLFLETLRVDCNELKTLPSSIAGIVSKQY